MEETTRQNLIMAFNNVLRTSALAGVVDAQRAALAFGTTLQETEEGVIHLGPLHDFLIQQGGAELAVAEVILFMKSREGRFGVRMALPAKLDALTPEQVDTIVLNFTSRGAATGAVVGPPVAPRPSSPEPSSSPAPPPPPPPSSPPPDFGAPTNEGDDKTRLKRLGIVAGVLAVGAVGTFAWQELTRGPPPTPFPLTDPAALPCQGAVGASEVVVCRVPVGFYEKEPAEAFDARAQVTKAAAMAKGYKRILVITVEDNKLRKVITW